MKKLLFLATAIFFFTSCKKEVNSIDKNNINYDAIQKSKELKIYERGNPSSFIIVNMKSENEKLLNKTFDKLNNSYVELIEGNPEEKLIYVNEVYDESDSLGISYDLNWDNFKFKEKQNKYFRVSITDKFAKTQTLLYTLNNINSFSTTSGVCIVGVANTYSYFNWGCLCPGTNSTWEFNYNSDFSNQICSQHFSQISDYIETQTFTEYGVAKYIMRLNYTGDVRPSYAIQTNSIKSGRGWDYWKLNATPANVTFWKWL